MIDCLEDSKFRDIFIKTNFEDPPFNFKSDGNNYYSLILKIMPNLEESNTLDEKYIKKFNIKFNDNFIELTYEKEIRYIYRYPIIFELYSEKMKTAFKVYDQQQLKEVLIILRKYYIFFVNGKLELEYENIIKFKNENNLLDNKIILLPIMFDIFNKFCYDNKLEEKTNNDNDIIFDIDKEILEPYFLHIEKEEIKKKVNDEEKMKKFDYKLLNNKLTFIMNAERRQFIKNLDDYIKVDIQVNPLMIIGNDGVGKSITLQFYTLLENKEYKKLYFNLKLLTKCNIRDYTLIELMRAFKDKKDKQINFKKYMEYVNLFQNKDYTDIKQFFINLNEIINKLKNTPEKYVIIFDQFNFEKIDITDIYNFKKK